MTVAEALAEWAHDYEPTDADVALARRSPLHRAFPDRTGAAA